jgi:choline kinase
MADPSGNASSAEESNAPRTGVILAAGFGSRLAGTQEATDLKPLTPVAGTPLLFRTLDSVARAGCERVVVVLGYEPGDIREAVEARYEGSLQVEYVRNERYDLSNGYSVLAARPLVDGPFLLTMADHVLSDALMERARGCTPPDGGATLLVDYQLDRVFDMDDATKVREKDDRIDAIGKTLDTYNCVDTGVFVCTQGLMSALQSAADEAGDVSLSDGVKRLAAAGRMHTLDVGDAFWQDVDTPAMLGHAEEHLRDEETASR